MALFFMPSASPRRLIGRLGRAVRAPAAVALLALTMVPHATPALAQTGADPRCAGIVPAPQPSTGRRIPTSYPTTVRFVNDSDWDISLRKSDSSGNAQGQVVRMGSSVDVTSATGTSWRWDTINNPYPMARGAVKVAQPAAQCFVLTRRAPPQPPLNPDPRCGGLVDAADPFTNLRVVNTGEQPIRFNLHGPGGQPVYQHDPTSKVVTGVTIPAGGSRDMAVRLFTNLIWDNRANTGALRQMPVDRRGAHCLVLPGDNGAARPGPTAQVTPAAPVTPAKPERIRPVTPAPAKPERVRPASPAPVKPAPVRPAPQVTPAPVRPGPVVPATPARPTTPAVAPTAPTLPAGPSAPTLPPPDTDHKPCSQQDLIALVKEGEKSGTIMLDGECRHQLVTPTSDWSGGTGVFVWNATRIAGNGAIIERPPTASQPFRLLGLSVEAGITIDNLTLRGGTVTGDGGGLYTLKPVILRKVTFENNTAVAVNVIASDRKTTARQGRLGGAVRTATHGLSSKTPASSATRARVAAPSLPAPRRPVSTKTRWASPTASSPTTRRYCLRARRLTSMARPARGSPPPPSPTIPAITARPAKTGPRACRCNRRSLPGTRSRSPPTLRARQRISASSPIPAPAPRQPPNDCQPAVHRSRSAGLCG